MQKITTRMLCITALLVQPIMAHAASRYDFTSGFGDTFGVGPNLNSLGGTLNSGFYDFGPNQGLTLDWSGIDQASYNITMRFSFATVGPVASWRKILDFEGRTTDEGLYVFNNRLEFVETTNLRDGFETTIPGADATFTPDQLVTLHITRDGATNLFTSSLDNVPQFSFVDAKGRAIFAGANPVAAFFADDSVTNFNEASGGRVDFITVGAVPLPATLPLLLSALGALSWWRRKFQY